MTVEHAPTEDDLIAISAALKRLCREGWTVSAMGAMWPRLSPATLTDLLDRDNPWRPFTPPMKAAYSNVLREAQAHDNQRLLRDAIEVAGNVVSLADHRARRSA